MLKNPENKPFSGFFLFSHFVLICRGIEHSFGAKCGLKWAKYFLWVKNGLNFGADEEELNCA